MPVLRDGDVVPIQGSASQPYLLKNIAGVFSCTCPAWRNQSLPIDRRTCKHLRGYIGETSESSRLGSVLVPPTAPKSKPQPPPLLLAESWDASIDPSGWLLSEKLDGVRAWWDGKQFLSRQGHRYCAPDWFTQGLPLVPLDGELWSERGQFEKTVGIVRRADAGPAWRSLRFVVFDAPGEPGVFPRRLTEVERIMRECQPPFAQAHPHCGCRHREHLDQELNRVLGLGGEGLMLRDPQAEYVIGRSSTLLKVKRFRELEARVIGYATGRGRHQGRVGALIAELPSGVRFQVGSGLSDADRDDPPAIGAWITVQYQELTGAGVPRFPVFLRVRGDLNDPSTSPKGEPMANSTSSSIQRFEFVGGTSAKFWQVQCQGNMLHIRFGRLGSHGQRQTKAFADAEKAQKQCDKLIREKLAKGYVAVG